MWTLARQQAGVSTAAALAYLAVLSGTPCVAGQVALSTGASKGGTPTDLAAEPLPRVRSDNPAIVQLIAQGSERSLTFRREIDMINRSDGLVYVIEGRCGLDVLACLMMTVDLAGPNRLLKVVVDLRRSDAETIAAIGHELWHAIEALGDAHVTDNLTMLSFFQHLGKTGRVDRFETPAAVKTGFDVFDEVTDYNKRQKRSVRRSQDDPNVRTVAAALKLADPHISSIPVIASTSLLQGLSPGAEGWTTFGEDGTAKSVFVYAGSETFRCAAKSREVTVCLMKLASILVHEAWHFEHGPDEDGAYEAQIVFLVRIGAPPTCVSGVIKAHQTEMRRDSHRIHIYRTVAETQTVAAGPFRLLHIQTSRTRVRSSDPALADLITRATQGSETFRKLLVTIEASNGIVYVEPGECGHAVRACLKMWMQVSGTNRFLRISINRTNGHSDIEVMGLLGHELQHAIEVLSEPKINDGLMMFNLFNRIAPTDNGRFETTAAVNAGNAVYDELRTSSRLVR